MRKPHHLKRRLPKRRKTETIEFRDAEVVIDRFGSKGDGITSINGKDVHIPFTLAGEKVKISYAGERGILGEILTQAEQRQDAICKHFGSCGGCKTQHLTPDFENDWRLNDLAEIFARAGLGEVKINQPWKSPLQSRRRATLSAEKRGKKIIVGFNKQATHDIVAIPDCKVLHKDILAIIPFIEACVALLANETNQRFSASITLLENGIDVDFAGREESTLSLVEREGLGALAQQYNLRRLTLEGQAFLSDGTALVEIAGIKVPLPAGGFLQATKEGENALTKFVLNNIDDGPVVDLFSGSGTFALPIAKKHVVHAVELGEAALAGLAQALKLSPVPLKKVTTEARDLDRRPLQAPQLNQFSTIILDPPRGGAAAQIKAIAASSVKRVIYISCNPKTFARDAKVLGEAGFEIKEVQPVDQFLFTPHIELATLLTRK